MFLLKLKKFENFCWKFTSELFFSGIPLCWSFKISKIYSSWDRSPDSETRKHHNKLLVEQQKPCINAILMLCSNILILSKFGNILTLICSFLFCPITLHTYYIHHVYIYIYVSPNMYIYVSTYVFHKNILFEFIYIEENRISKAELPNWKYIDVK